MGGAGVVCIYHIPCHPGSVGIVISATPVAMKATETIVCING